jgi:thiol:disulfide interchange protein DsbD
LLFLIFLFFAGSFFGYYDITLPSSIANKSSKAEEAGGIIGIFFMALTLVIVSFSCTGPILGSLLGSAVTGSANVPMLLTFALAGFGLVGHCFRTIGIISASVTKFPKSEDG